MVISLAAIIGTGMVAQSIEYKEGFGMKQMAWITHAAVMGAMLAPMMYLGGPILTRAAWYTMGVVGGLSTIAVSGLNFNFLIWVLPFRYCISSILFFCLIHPSDYINTYLII